jgi:hypothetical protein
MAAGQELLLSAIAKTGFTIGMEIPVDVRTFAHDRPDVKTGLHSHQPRAAASFNKSLQATATAPSVLTGT